jgi:hypothetical protein
MRTLILSNSFLAQKGEICCQRSPRLFRWCASNSQAWIISLVINQVDVLRRTVNTQMHLYLTTQSSLVFQVDSQIFSMLKLYTLEILFSPNSCHQTALCNRELSTKIASQHAYKVSQSSFRPRVKNKDTGILQDCYICCRRTWCCAPTYGPYACQISKTSVLHSFLVWLSSCLHSARVSLV